MVDSGDLGNSAPDVAADEALWDERYRSRGALWSGDPNPHLVSEVSDLMPARALDVGCGEGADAIWLAKRGWQVTAVDFSTIALERGAARAVETGADVAGRITWLHADLTEWVSPASYDLVSAQFMHLPRDQREGLHRRLAAWVAPDGTVLIVGHHPSDMETTVPRPRARGWLFTGDEIAAQLDPPHWDIVTNEVLARITNDPDGHTVTVHDTVLRARKLTTGAP